jgi:Flp pilus assembly protein TadD
MSATRSIAARVAPLVALAVLAGCAGPFRHAAPRGAADAAAARADAGHDRHRRETREHDVDPATWARAQAAQLPDEPFWPYRLAELNLAADSTRAAEAALRVALVRDRSYAPALALLSKIEFDAGRHAEAIRMLEDARARVEDFPDGFPPQLVSGLALHYDAIGRVERADSLMATIATGDRKAVREAGVYLALRGADPAAAAAPAGADLKDNPKSAVRHNNYGITRLRAGDPVAARKAFDQAIALDPSLPGPYYNLAILEKFYLFEDREAARWFQAYRQRSNADPDSLAGVFEGAQKPVAQKGN